MVVGTFGRLKLQNELEPGFIGGIPLLFRQNLWIRLDGCPIHYARPVKQWLNDHYPQRWIGRGGSISWPQRSSDITLIFICGEL